MLSFGESDAGQLSGHVRHCISGRHSGILNNIKGTQVTHPRNSSKTSEETTILQARKIRILQKKWHF